MANDDCGMISCRPPAVIFVGSKKGTLLLADSINKVSCCSCVWRSLSCTSGDWTRFGATGLHVLLQGCIVHATAVGLHGDMAQQRRTEIVREFLDGRHSVIVATNVLARGVDLQNVHQVILIIFRESRLLYFHLHVLLFLGVCI